MSEELPPAHGWARFAIDDIAESIQYGHTASATEDATGPRFLRITDIQDGRVDWSAVPSCDIDASDTGKYLLRSGDLVFARTGATTGKSFLIRDCPRAVFASYLIRLRMRAEANPAFVAYFFQSPSYWRQIEAGKRGIGQPNVNGTILGRVTMPLAPLPEQRRIVAKIEELFSDLDAGVAALERVKANLKRYRAAVLKAAVEGRLTEEWRKHNPPTETGEQLLKRILAERRAKWDAEQLRKFAEKGKEPGKGWREKYKQPAGADLGALHALPDGWTWAIADQLCSQVTDGEHIQPPYQATGKPMLTATHVRDDGVRFENVGLIAEDAFDKAVKRCAPSEGDLLIVSVGATTGRAGVVGPSEPFAIVRSVLLLKPLLSPKYLLRWVQSPWCSRWIGGASGATAQAHFYISDAKRMPIPVPPIAELSEVVAEVDRRLSVADAAEKQVEAALRRAARLRQAILKRAFEGRLVPQDPADEPVRVGGGESGAARELDTAPARRRGRPLKAAREATKGAGR